jgi:hypothetical protein
LHNHVTNIISCIYTIKKILFINKNINTPDGILP